MRTSTTSLSMIVTLLFIAYPRNPLAAASAEINGTIPGGIQVVTGADLYTGDFRNGALNNATGIRVGNELFLYVQGSLFGSYNFGAGTDADKVPCRRSDDIYLFKAPFSQNGLHSRLQFVRRINDCTGHSYGPGQPFFSQGRYWMVVDRSDNVDFFKLYLGDSVDAVQWTWSPFIESTSAV